MMGVVAEMSSRISPHAACWSVMYSSKVLPLFLNILKFVIQIVAEAHTSRDPDHMHIYYY